MKSIAFLTFTLFIVLTIDSIVAPRSKYKLASIAHVSVNEGEDPWGPFRQHIQDYNLSPKTIGKNCRGLPCDAFPCPSECGPCTRTKKNGMRCTTHPDTLAQQSGCSGLNCFGGRSSSSRGVVAIRRE